MRTSLYMLLLIGIFLSACSKSFLDVPVTREVVAEEYISDLTTAQHFLNGIYFLTAKDIYETPATAYADVMADNMIAASWILPVQYNWSMIKSMSSGYDDNMNEFWLRGYNVIRSCNFLLENVDRVGEGKTAEVNAIKGQLYGLRALVHFNLLNVFAQPYIFTADASHPGIPYDTIYDTKNKLKREPVAEVYRLIIADIERATGLIPENWTNRSLMTRPGLSALLARVLLFKGDYQHAGNIAAGLVAQFPIMAQADYPQQLFTPADNETLFKMSPASSSTTSGTGFLGTYIAVPGTLTVSPGFAAVIRERPADKRNSWIFDTLGAIEIRKYPRAAVPGMKYPNSAYYQPVVRSSEMVLTAAESLAMQGREDSARYYLDLIRNRADATAGITTAAGPALLDSIYKERRKELCFENLRMYDLLRWQQDVRRKGVGASPDRLPYPSSKAISPIPLTDENIGGLEQNKDY